MATVQRWSGREVRALREAKRMSVRTFAEHLGVSDRMVSKWEAGGAAIVPRPINQTALDTSLACSSTEVQMRFGATMGTTTLAVGDQVPGDLPAPVAAQQVRHPVDGKLMTMVEAGDFLRGSDNESAWLPSFFIDVFPVTNAEYAKFVVATDRKPPEHWNNGRCPEHLFDHPVVFVTWRDATAYAARAAKELPSARQWEKAARGTRGDIYPWGSQLTPAKCNVREAGIGGTTPVNRYHSGVSPYGAYDMCGNTWEWCSTQSEPARYELKGSAFTSPFFRATPSEFNDASADMLDDDTGFRCVTPAETMQALIAIKG